MKKYRLVKAKNNFEEYYYIQRKILFWWVKMEFRDISFGFKQSIPVSTFDSFDKANRRYLRLILETKTTIIKNN